MNRTAGIILQKNTQNDTRCSFLRGRRKISSSFQASYFFARRGARRKHSGAMRPTSNEVWRKNSRIKWGSYSSPGPKILFVMEALQSVQSLLPLDKTRKGDFPLQISLHRKHPAPFYRLASPSLSVAGRNCQCQKKRKVAKPSTPERSKSN